MAHSTLRASRLDVPEHDAFDNEPIIITVGSGEDVRRFRLLPAPLAQKSQNFANMLKGAWKESTENKIDLPDDNPEAFSVYALWICGMSFLPHKDHTCEDDTEIKKQIDAHYTELVDLYLLGQKLIDHDFMDLVVDAIIRQIRRGQQYLIEHVIQAYTGPRPQSGLCKLFVDDFRHNAGYEWMAQDDQLPPDFTYDLALAYAKDKALTGSFRTASEWQDALAATCQYHSHTTEKKPCYLNKYPKSVNSTTFEDAKASQPKKQTFEELLRKHYRSHAQDA